MLTGLAQGLKWLLVSLLISILIEWAGMVFWWEEQGLAHSRQMLANELHWLGTGFYQDGWTARIASHVYHLSDRAYGLLFERTGIVEFLHWITPAPSAHESGIRPRMNPASARCCTAFMHQCPNMSWPPCR